MSRLPTLSVLALLALCATARAHAPAEPGPSAPPAHCPQAGEQLDDLLASAMQRHAQEGEVRMAFLVDASGRAVLSTVEGARRYHGAVRRAVEALQCRAGEPQRYDVQIRFRDQRSVRPSQLAPH